ncbi:TonB-dependent receptor [Pseudomonas gingeri NCPPB 3146 = LMG 5327]|uniref:TonB-dependent receptor n=2 Tax=Pseudomonas gingeri TaxID=117681 RepID=A0A7Y7XZ24_9PSED|nr:TonB-dependent receptor [Pseudomonas gingeri]NWC14705.1 TonB-dependent receptor [Pseudomonas gingeri]PNQ91251.1 TonB-dependent receptor [Pseudomonas gingeri NCPPB 3146 = LMG 5327]
MSRSLDTLLRPSLLAAAMTFGASLLSPTLFAAEQTSSVRAYNLPAAPLSSTLNQIASQAGLALSLDPALASGKTSAPVNGQFDVITALHTALAGTGLQLVQSGAGTFTLIPAPEGAMALPATNISAKAAAPEGSEEAGYVSENITSVGALGGMKLQDTPYSMSVTSQAMLKNFQATSLDDVFKRNPFTQLYSPTSAGYASAVNIRGFSSAGSLNIANDGLRFTNGADAGNFLEENEQLEIITGLTGFLYGPGSPGGLANYVLKRPTYERYNSVTLGNAGGENYYLHGDFGGPIDSEGKFAYRLNVLTQDGETAIDMQKRRREMVSLALDWNVNDDLLVQFDASHKKTENRGVTSYWYFGDQKLRPRASTLDNDKLYSQKWSFSDNETDKAGVRAKWRLNDVFTLRAAVAAQQYTEENTYTGPTVYSPGVYTQPLYAFAPIDHEEQSAYVFLDSAFSTGSLEHKMTVGYQGNASRIKQSEDHIPYPGPQYQSPVGTLPIGDSVQVGKPSYSIGNDSKRLANSSVTNNYLIGDVIKFNDEWSTILGATHTQIRSYAHEFVYAKAFGTPETETRYDESKTSPNVSLIYKPIPWLTTYVTYIEGLESGGVAPSGTTNAGQAFAPQISKQYEIGAKATVGETLLTLALFNIDKPNGYTNGLNTYVVDGRQENNGLEFSVTGKVLPDLTVISGFTLLDPKVKKTSVAANEGNAPTNVAKQLAKVYAEYDVNAVPGFALTGGAFYTGRQYTDESNDNSLPAFTTFDAGARYRMRLSENNLTLRMNVSNLTNKEYWLNSSYLGDPRTLAFSAQLEF